MSEEFRQSCVCGDDRPSNDELSALIARVAACGQGDAQPLFAAVAPLLTAFYEGQVQAGRARREDLQSLVDQAFAALCRRRQSYDSAYPFRAWLIEVARSTLRDYLRSHDANPVDATLALAACGPRKVMRAV
jgi:RNA polymerase sigma-70 factor, ECF subfamily